MFKFFVTAVLIFTSAFLYSQQNVISTFENPSEWQIVSSEGASINLETVPGVSGSALKINYNFTGAGWCGIQYSVKTALPENYKFSYYVSGSGLRNNLEFKLLDSTGENVWWHHRRNFSFPSSWEKLISHKRDVRFAWGPAGGGDITNADALQFIVAASEGGSGYIILDELTLQTIEPETASCPLILYSSPKLTADSLNSLPALPVPQSPDDNNLIIDQSCVREIGGLIILWDSLHYPSSYRILLSDDSTNWRTVFTAASGIGGYDFINLKDETARYIGIQLISESPGIYHIKNIEIKDYTFSRTPNSFFTEIAGRYPRGYYPKYLYGEQSYWNIIGAGGDISEALINEEGMIETGKEGFSVEPFLFLNNEFITWNDVKREQGLTDAYLPIPYVKWLHSGFSLQIKSFASGSAAGSNLHILYKLRNSSDSLLSGNFYLAARPFQVNPPWQDLNFYGGVSKISSLSYHKNYLQVNDKKIYPLTEPPLIGAAPPDVYDVVRYIKDNILPASNGSAASSAALGYPVSLAPGDSAEFRFVIPLSSDSEYSPSSADFDSAYKQAVSYWRGKLDKIDFGIPSSEAKYINTLKSNTAYILINRDGPAIQPGSRTYERAWIRDGALTSSALLRLGMIEEVKEYIDWYSRFQFPSGKIPCVVDKRGADPTPEHDSHGQYIFAVLQYYRFTKDSLFLHSHFPNITGAVNYIEYLTNLRKTKQYTSPDSSVFYGILPESISHEGYSAKPMHSYWDDFFALRGLKDAAEAASVLGKKEEYERFSAIKDDFQKNLYSSINKAIDNHNINYIPGSAELGDFDATSTAIALYPCGEQYNIPPDLLNNTFQKYYEYFENRKNGLIEWSNYTPYEVRNAGAFVHLNQKEKAHEILNYFFNDQRPAGWNHWAEVVWKDKDNPRFIGDMPHTWIGSDYINTVRSFFVYENETDSTLILGAGIPDDWLAAPEGVSVKNLPTYYGPVTYTLKKKDEQVELFVEGSLSIPSSKIIPHPSLGKVKLLFSKNISEL